IERGMLALTEAYQLQRPGDARISGLNYAPPPSTRGASADKFDALARDRAESILQEAVHERGGPDALHALGRVYLAKREYDKAIQQFEAALASTPNDARLHSDLGAAFMERGNNSPAGESDGAKLADYARALEQFNRALELDPSLLEALFNRALLHERM